MNTTLRKNIVAAALLATVGFGAFAQAPAAPVAPQPGQHQAHPHHGGQRAGAEARQERHQHRFAQRFERLKQTLKITPAQEGAWNQWLQAMKPQGKRGERPNFVAYARMSTPERIDAMRTLRAERAAMMDRRGEATKAFYAGLTAEQKKTFDERSIRFGGKGHRGHGGQGHRGHGGHGHHGHHAQQGDHGAASRG